MKIEADAGYIVKIGEPVCIAEVKATSTSVSIPCDPIADGDYLISLEVNGTVTARRESFSFASGSATVGDYTVAYASNAVTVSTTEENDIVNIMIEPLKVFTTDEFKAAVAKVAPKAAASDGGSSGGGTGGGVLVVTATEDGDNRTLDKTWQEIFDADEAIIVSVVNDAKSVTSVSLVDLYNGVYEVQAYRVSSNGYISTLMYTTDNANGYPSISNPK